MVIQIFITVPENNLTTKWCFEVQYFKEHGNTQSDIWNTNDGYIQNTSLYQLYLKAVLESLIYMNTLALKLKPDTREIMIHLPCEICIKWLTDNEDRMLSPKDRIKVERGYRQFIKAIKVEMSEWKIQYKLTKER